ncbi:MAG: heavy metal translocating P-type ATPase [Pirellulaceae bacterium]|nr:heavy metal translocating P-type ATPase [Pirellulaceae bacterium]
MLTDPTTPSQGDVLTADVARAPGNGVVNENTPENSLPCSHCGLPSAVTSQDTDAPVFCCSGCQGAYELIDGWGLADFYALRDQLDVEGQTSISGGRRDYSAFDSNLFLGPSTPVTMSDGLQRTRLSLHALHCGACAWLIENAASRTDGWLVSRVSLVDHTINIVFDPSKIKLSEIARLLDKLGYEPAPQTTNSDDAFVRQNRKLLMQIAVAGFCAANAMWIGIALYAGEFSGVAASHWNYLRLIGTGLGIVSVVGPGRTFFRGALASIRTRTPHMDLPVAAGLSVGTIAGTINAVTGRGSVYFDSLAVLVFLLLLGRWIQFRQQHRAARSVDLLLRITPRHAKRLGTDGECDLVLVDSLQVGDVVEVSAGEGIPVDGTITNGQTTVDRSLLTGESEPIMLGQGEKVVAGSVNLTRLIQISVDAIGQQTRIGRLMKTVETAAATKTPIGQLADRIGGVFVVVVTILALVTLLAWWQNGWAIAAEHATSLLIVACPCALALATPLAIAVAIGRSAHRKILVRDGSSMQRLSGSGTVWFDKTGTLTEGRPRVVEMLGDTEAIGLAAAIEAHCCHPVADCIITEAHRLRLDIPADAFLEGVGSGGITGRSGGRSIAVGTLNFLRKQSVSICDEFSQAAENFSLRGHSPVTIAVDGRACTMIGIVDPIRRGAAESIGNLRKSGWRIGILSGDNRQVVQQVAQKVGIDQDVARGELSPEDKLEIVRRTGADAGSVVMIGDGANDAAALAAADVGIAVRGGAEISLQAAPIYLASTKLVTLAELFDAARSTKYLIYTTFAVSLSYNLVAVSLAMAGQISPLLAAVLMPISSVSVLALTLGWPIYRGSQP